jgi:nucleotide-binding universal stress UspA family protein
MYQKILVPLDGSELAECSLEHAKAIVQGCNVADLTVLRVIEPLSAQAISALVAAGDDFLRKATDQKREDAQDYALKVQKRFKTQGIITQAVTVEGRASDEILSYAEKNNADLIVMSTHGKSGLSRFFFGSVAEKVSRHSRVPVLLISPGGCRTFAP